MDAAKAASRGEKLPKVVYLDTPAALPRWIDAVKKAAETVLYSGWRTSVKVGGALFKEMEREIPDHAGVKKMLHYGRESREHPGARRMLDYEE